MKRFYENCRKKTLSVTKTALVACPRSIGRLKGMNMNYLKLVSGCFHKNGYINRSFLKKVFQDMLSEKQIRGLISKMKNAGIIQKDGAGKYTRYVKAPDFPSFV